MSNARRVRAMLLFDHPWVLALVPLAALPWLSQQSAPARGHPWLPLLPADRISAVLDASLKLLASAALAACVLGLAGPASRPVPVEHVGRGAQLIVLLDRSRSMDEPLAADVPTGALLSGRTYGGYESKGAAARRLLGEFAAHRSHDQIGMLAFSTNPIRILGFTAQPASVAAAVRAGNIGRGLAETDVGAGLLAALAEFHDRTYNGSRVILLVSDGGARLDGEIQQRIANAMQRERVSLYWLYLRSNRSAGLTAGDARSDEVPEQALHAFFGRMNVPYHAYEAADPGALERAVADVDRLEHLPIRYALVPAARDYSRFAYGGALLCCLLLLLARALEVRG